MLFTLEVLPAAEGDCLLLHWGSAGSPKLAVIDGGPGQTYEKTLRPRLDDIVDNLGASPLALELVMISHMDSDHIVGIKKLIRQVKREVDQQLPAAKRPIALKRLWHNVFNDVLGDSIDRYYQTLTASYQASISGRPNPALVDELASEFHKRRHEGQERAREDAWDVALVLAGHGDGREVRDDYEYLYQQHLVSPPNSPFKDSHGRPTLVTAPVPAPATIGGLELVVVGPSKAELEALQKEFDKYIKDKGLTATAVLAAYADASIKNLSSIVCLARLGTKTMLLTGDARGDKIIAGLEKAGLLAPGGTLSVDILKVPHHGSDRNVEAAFFGRIHADTYVVSADGKYGNPDRDTIQWIVDARGKAAKFTIVLTYPVKHIDDNRKDDFRKHSKTWNQKADALEALFKNTDAAHYAFSLKAGGPHKIELGDEKVAW